MTLRCSARNRVGLALPLRWAAPRCVPVDEEGTLCQRSSTNRRGRHNWSTTTCRGSGLEHGLQGAGLDRRARRRHQGRKPAKARDGADRHPLTPVSSRARCRSDGCPGHHDDLWSTRLRNRPGRGRRRLRAGSAACGKVGRPRGGIWEGRWSRRSLARCTEHRRRSASLTPRGSADRIAVANGRASAVSTRRQALRRRTARTSGGLVGRQAEPEATIGGPGHVPAVNGRARGRPSTARGPSRAVERSAGASQSMAIASWRSARLRNASATSLECAA